MALTSKLGFNDSQLANIQFGGGETQSTLGSASNTLSLTHQVTVQLALNRTVSHTLSLSHTLVLTSLNQVVSNTLALTHTVARQLVLNRSITHTLNFTTLNTVERRRTASNTITFTGTATGTTVKAASNTIVFTQTPIHHYNPHFENPTVSPGLQSLIPFVSTATKQAVFNKSASNTLSLNHTATALRVRLASASNLFVMTHNAANVKIQQPNNTITFTHSATQFNIHIRSLTSTLNLTHTLARQVLYNRSLTSNLIFLNLHNRNGVQVPTVTVTIPKQFVKLFISNRLIILPAPHLGDTEGLTNELLLKRTTSGGTYTYIRKNKDRVLKYEFDFDRKKAFELRSFIDLSAGQKMTMENWKGEIWSGFIVNNPFDFTTETRSGSCGERFVVTIEFDGVRIH